VIGATFAAVVISGMLTVSVPPRVDTGHASKIPIASLQSATPAQKSTNPGHPGQNHGYRMGSWLQAHKDLPLDQQLKLLEADPKFKKLPADRQNALRDQLKKFDSLSPEKRDQALKRMQFLAKLTPQQRQQLRDASQQLRGLPPERRVAVHKAVRHLRQMPADQRKQELASDRFKSTFSDQEQKLIGELAELSVPDGQTK
jgi:Protein of unknown function (DUF3106)